MELEIPIVFKSCLFALLIGLVIGVHACSAVAADIPNCMRLVAETEYLSLYMDDVSTEIAVLDKMTDVLWYSNPPDRDRTGGAASETLRIAYATPTTDRAEMDSFNHSVVLGQYRILPIDKGVRVEYRLGDEYKDVRYTLPQLISKDRMDTVLSNVSSESDREFILKYYVLITLERDSESPEIEPGESTRPWWKFWGPNVEPRVDESSVESVETVLFGGHKLVALDDTLRLREQAVERLESEVAELRASGEAENSAQMQRLARDLNRAVSYYERDRGQLVWKLLSKYMGTIVAQYGRSGGRRDVQSIHDLTQDDFKALRNSPAYMLNTDTSFYLEDMSSIFEAAGYTIEDMYEDHVTYHLEPPIKSLEVFDVPVEYTLDDRSLVVRIPMDDVCYPHEVPEDLEFDFDDPEGNVVRYKEGGKRKTLPLFQIDVLRYFGAAGVEQKGYVFVPDGCGALIHLNNGRLDYPIYSEPVYGTDRSIPQGETLPYDKQTHCLPVFGMKQGDRAWYAVIEEGEAVANVRADIARTQSSYNVAFASFNTMSRMLVSAGGAKVMTYQPSICRSDIQIRYTFLDRESADYVGMAKDYRDYLIVRHGLERLAQHDLPMFVELVGAVTKVQPVIGVPMRTPVALTTFTDAKSLVADLLEAGIGNLKVRYSGWLEGGLLHDYPVEAGVEKVLGTTEQFQDLIRFLSMWGVDLFPDVSFLAVSARSGLLDGFNVRRNAARFLDGLMATVSEYDPVTLLPTGANARYILSPSTLPGLIDRFLSDYARYGNDALSLGDLGAGVNSDFHRGRFVGRQQAKEIIEQQCQKISQGVGIDTLFATGNAYVFAHTRNIVNVPTQSTNHGLENEAVPFYQIVVHGLFDFAGTPLNTASDVRDAFLRSIETGSGLHFQWIAGEPSVVKATDFDHLLNVAYDRWRDRAVAAYHEANAVLKPVQGRLIDNHEKLADGVYRTTYDNGYAVIVNYNDRAVRIEELTVEAKGFSFEMGGEIH